MTTTNHQLWHDATGKFIRRVIREVGKAKGADRVRAYYDDPADPDHEGPFDRENIRLAQEAVAATDGFIQVQLFKGETRVAHFAFMYDWGNEPSEALNDYIVDPEIDAILERIGY